MEAGSPPCSPQMPTSRPGRAARPFSTAIRISPADADGVERLGEERVVRQDLLLHVLEEEAALSVVAAVAVGQLRQVVRAEA